MVKYPKYQYNRIQADLKYQVKKRVETEEQYKKCREEHWKLRQDKNQLYADKEIIQLKLKQTQQLYE